MTVSAFYRKGEDADREEGKPAAKFCRGET